MKASKMNYFKTHQSPIRFLPNVRMQVFDFSVTLSVLSTEYETSLRPVGCSARIVQGLNLRERAHLGHYCRGAICQTTAVPLACRSPLPRSWQQILPAITAQGPWRSGGRPLILQPAPSLPHVRVPSILWGRAVGLDVRQGPNHTSKVIDATANVIRLLYISTTVWL